MIKSMKLLAIGSQVPWQISGLPSCLLFRDGTWQDAQDGGLPMDSLNEGQKPEERPEEETILGYDVEMGSWELHGVFFLILSL